MCGADEKLVVVFEQEGPLRGVEHRGRRVWFEAVVAGLLAERHSPFRCRRHAEVALELLLDGVLNLDGR